MFILCCYCKQKGVQQKRSSDPGFWNPSQKKNLNRPRKHKKEAFLQDETFRRVNQMYLKVFGVITLLPEQLTVLVQVSLSVQVLVQVLVSMQVLVLVVVPKLVQVLVMVSTIYLVLVKVLVKVLDNLVLILCVVIHYILAHDIRLHQKTKNKKQKKQKQKKKLKKHTNGFI